MTHDKRLHVYSQIHGHDSVYIVGDLSGLLALRKAVDEALDRQAGKQEAFAGDGEGFEIIVARVDSSADWENLLLPYPIEGVPEGSRPEVIPPWNLPQVAKRVAR
jgi:hypothetical protein